MSKLLSVDEASIGRLALCVSDAGTWFAQSEKGAELPLDGSARIGDACRGSPEHRIVDIFNESSNSSAANQPSGTIPAEYDDDPRLPGEYIAPHPGPDGRVGTIDDRQHLSSGQAVPICTEAQLKSGNVSTPLCYTSNPPTSGPHDPQPMPFRILQNPAPKENLVHNMEHGGIVVWYNTSDLGVIRQMEAVVRELIDARRFVVLTRYQGMEAETIAITAWTRIDKFPARDFNGKRLEDFVSEHHKRFNPEGF